MSIPHKDPSQRPVAVVVPVYRNLHVTKNCLESLLASNLPADASITVINDNSPDEEVGTYCQELAQQARIRLVVNEENRGFVVTANKGFALHPDADIILLNSDTTVPNNWVQRLQLCAYKEAKIGTVTPFSNNGTICSYPVFPTSNNLPALWNAIELDRTFQSANPGAYCEIPTAVGFCMYIKRSCLDETGPFDEENFGQGYGEECDFSLRASAREWKHTVAADIFVYHEGAVSFASESNERKHRADKIMDELHPQYHQLVTDFIQLDPLYKFRSNVDAIRLVEKPADSQNILEEHFSYARSLLERVEQNRQLALQREVELRAALAGAEQLDQMLTDCRQRFAETDRALEEAQKIIGPLIAERDKAMSRINSMEKSRSWRYTAWLRQEK